MLYQPLVSLLMLFAATSGVAASATPVRRGGGYPAPVVPAISQSQCNTAPQCCQQLTSTSNPILGSLGVLSALANTNLPVGVNCANIIATQPW
jgi:hypothetical protein